MPRDHKNFKQDPWISLTFLYELLPTDYIYRYSLIGHNDVPYID